VHEPSQSLRLTGPVHISSSATCRFDSRVCAP
jgi:hypothetical protein